MDDETLFGPELHRLGFGEAVAAGLLTDYKVLVLAVDEKYVCKVFQSQLADAQPRAEPRRRRENRRLLERAVQTRRAAEDTFDRTRRRCGGQWRSPASIKDSKRIHARCSRRSSDVLRRAPTTRTRPLHCEVEHVDGTFNALRRNEKLDWLKAQTPGDDEPVPHSVQRPLSVRRRGCSCP